MTNFITSLFIIGGTRGRLNYIGASFAIYGLLTVAILAGALLMDNTATEAPGLIFIGLAGVAFVWGAFNVMAQRLRDMGWDVAKNITFYLIAYSVSTIAMFNDRPDVSSVVGLGIFVYMLFVLFTPGTSSAKPTETLLHEPAGLVESKSDKTIPIASSQESTLPPASREPTNAKSNQVTQTDAELDYPKARTAIEYRDDAAKNWKIIQEFPIEFQREFLANLDANPKLATGVLTSELIAKHESELNPFETEELNAAYAQILKLGSEAAKEFCAVYKVVGETVPVAVLLERVRQKFPVISGTHEPSVNITPEPSENEKRSLHKIVTQARALSSRNVREIGVISDYVYAVVDGRNYDCWYYFGKRTASELSIDLPSFDQFRKRYDVPDTFKPILIWSVQNG